MRNFLVFGFLTFSIGALAAKKTEAETHLLLCPEKWDQVAQKLKFDEDEREEYQAYFIDNPNLDLFNSGLVLRVRDFDEGKDKITVKMRRHPEWNLEDEWMELDDFKCEIDAFGGERQNESCSLSSKKDDVETFLEHRAPLSKLFDKDQKKFLKEFSLFDVFDESLALRILGPISVVHWEDEDRNLDLEMWRLPNDKLTLELSQKVSATQIGKSVDYLKHLTDKAGLKACDIQGSKTKTALEWFNR